MVDGILSQGEVESAIVSAVEELEDAVADLAQLAQDAAIAESEFKRDWAKALITATAGDGKATEKTRVAIADAEASDQRLRWLLAQGLYESRKQSLQAIRAKLDALRTISANVRSLT